MSLNDYIGQHPAGSFPEQQHHYGEKIHLIGNNFTNSLLAKFGSPELSGVLLFNYLKLCYQSLLQAAILKHYAAPNQIVTSRMIEHTPKGKFSSLLIDPEIRSVVVDVARAGIYPAQVCYEMLSLITNPSNIRQDHIYINRKVNDAGQVIGNTLAGSKIGGDIANSMVIFPDPMGATGGTLSYVLSHYYEKTKSKPLGVIALHLIITPEYIKRVTKDCPEIEVYALRLDRGLSTPKALAAIPGTFKDEEFGLNEFQYIVPGAGGVGEVLNNSFV
jgi:uracil phosphoribosyltransferase